ncbi:hypothetical protein [Desulfatirhabdium butyrativorans]|uniref:hypothetical protein n=1 Tax=Desulfatirhabdium butyrativorans TaxID=340467 RepID=UPI0012EBFD6F|nr:hypothetical protein [Desulfatirhabdium butyrativorans]
MQTIPEKGWCRFVGSMSFAFSNRNLSGGWNLSEWAARNSGAENQPALRGEWADFHATVFSIFRMFVCVIRVADESPPWKRGVAVSQINRIAPLIEIKIGKG